MLQSRSREICVWMAVMLGSLITANAHAQKQNSEPDASGAQKLNSVPSGPAPILMTVHEIPQPGAEAAHAKLEAEYAAALDAGKGNQYYLGMGAITGTPQTVFLSGYSSLQEMEDVHDQDEEAMGEKLAGLDEEHSGTLAGTDTAIWRLRPSLSNPGSASLADMRMMDLIHIHVKLGHGPEFADVIKQIRESWMKADPDFHYSIYQQAFGNSMDDSYLVVIPLRSLADLDKHHAAVAQYRKSLGQDAEKRMLEFESASYDSVDSNLFAFTPSMSRLPATWTKNDAEFWNAKPAPAVPVGKPAKAK